MQLEPAASMPHHPVVADGAGRLQAEDLAPLAPALKNPPQQPRQVLQIDVVEEIVISKHYLIYALYNIC